MKIRLLRYKMKNLGKMIQQTMFFIGLIGFAMISFPQNGTAEKKLVESEKISLSEALYRISIEYQVFFSYDQETVKDVVVHYEPDRYENVEHALDRMLTGTSLHYRMFNNRYIILYESHPEAINSLKDMVQHLESVIDKEEKGPRRNSTSSLPPLPARTNSFSVAPIIFSVSGTVTDQDGEPLIGVNIQVKDSSKGTATDFDGHFTLEDIDENAILVISYVGYQTQEVAIAGKSTLEIEMVSDAELLDEVVVVGYGTQRKSTLTGAVSVIESDKLTVTPVGNVTNTLTGKLPGLIATQSQGLPGSDQANLNIRGFGSPLVIVDGVEANLINLDPNQIESVTILKDGASSIYGARAGNGVILVTTKRGKVQKPTISLRTSYTMQGVTNMAKTLNSGEWTQLQREAHLNSGEPEETAPYTKEEVERYYSGDDPSYPSSDWYDFTFRKWAPQQNHNITLRGGSEKIKYMGYLGYQNQETIIKKNGGDYKRFNIMSNIDASITEDLLLTIDINGIYENSKFAGRGFGDGDGISWQDLYATRPYYPTELPDPTFNAYGGADVGSVALSTDMDVWGYRLNKPRDLRGTITLSYEVPFIAGLSAKAFVNYIDIQVYNKRFQRPYEFYTYDYGTDEYRLAGNLWPSAESDESVNFNRRFTQQYSLSYDNSFNHHQIGVLALFEGIDYASNNLSAFRRDFLTPEIEQLFAGSAASQTNNGSASEQGRCSIIGRINYNYKEKYLVEGILRADASSKFIENKRWGYFPGISLGWVITEEDFFKGGALEFLKLRTSYGSSGNDAVGDFKYLTGYQINGNLQWGNQFISGLQSTGLANPNLTWEEMQIYNFGIDYSVLNGFIYGSMETFYRSRTGIPGSRAISYPSTFGASLPTENINSLNDRGFELSIGLRKEKGDFSYDISTNLSWSRAKWEHYDEPNFEDSDKNRINKKSGQWTDRVFGYIADGLFANKEEIEELSFVYSELGDNSRLRPGDVKYVDVNGDGVLDWRDQVEIGKGNMPHWFYGMSGFFAYKGFDLSTMFQGAFGYSSSSKHYYTNTDIYFKLRWTENENNPNSLIPRPGGSSSNDWTSDYWIKSVFYLRLKTFSLGYTFPKPITNSTGIDKIRMYVSGSNLFTMSTLKKYYIDPEANSGSADRYYPQPRTISFGINLDF